MAPNIPLTFQRGGPSRDASHTWPPGMPAALSYSQIR